MRAFRHDISTTVPRHAQPPAPIAGYQASESRRTKRRLSE